MEKTPDRPPMVVGALKGASREALKPGRGQAKRANGAALLLRRRESSSISSVRLLPPVPSKGEFDADLNKIKSSLYFFS